MLRAGMPVTTPYELVSVKKLVMVLLYGGMVVEVDSSAATAAAGVVSCAYAAATNGARVRME